MNKKKMSISSNPRCRLIILLSLNSLEKILPIMIREETYHMITRPLKSSQKK